MRRMIQSSKYEMRRLRQVAALVKGRTVLDIGYAEIPNPKFADVLRVGYKLNKPNSNDFISFRLQTKCFQPMTLVSVY